MKKIETRLIMKMSKRLGLKYQTLHTKNDNDVLRIYRIIKKIQLHY